MNNLNIKNNSNDEFIATEIASFVNNKLKNGNKVLLLVSGGSAIPMQVLLSNKIEDIINNKLVVTLTDERYGHDNHQDSNWFKLINDGFKISGAKLVPILCNKNIQDTTESFVENLENELRGADYKIGIFGVGTDSHTAGILPHSVAVNSNNLACCYEAPPFNRITITPRVISILDEAFLYAIGESKKLAVEKINKDSPIEDEPVQVLKKVPLLTIYTDNK